MKTEERHELTLDDIKGYLMLIMFEGVFIAILIFSHNYILKIFDIAYGICLNISSALAIKFGLFSGHSHEEKKWKNENRIEKIFDVFLHLTLAFFCISMFIMRWGA